MMKDYEAMKAARDIAAEAVKNTMDRLKIHWNGQSMEFASDTKDLLIRDIRKLEKRSQLLGLNLTTIALDEAADEATHENSSRLG